MEFDIRQYLRLITKWWWLLVIGTIIPVAATYYFLSQQPALYQTRVVLMVGTTMQSANPDLGKMGLSEQLARGYAAMVRYRPVTNAVIQKLGLNRTPETLADQISAYVHPEANLLEIIVIDTDPKMAALIANALANELIEQSPGSQTHSDQQQFVEEQLTKLKAKIEQVEQEIEEQNAELSNLTSAAEIKTAEDNLQSLESVLSRYRSEHTLYLQSYAGASVNQLTIVEPAIEPTYPKGGKKILVLAVAAAAGLGLAVAGVLLIEFMDETLRWESNHAEMLMGLPVLGAIGRMSNGTSSMLARIQERSPEAESVRAVRTTILLRRLRDPYQTLLFTSASSGEGKSFAAANLGISMAADGMRIIVVDADMRKPTLHELFDRPNTFGLADLLNHNTPLEDVQALRGLQSTDLANLWFLSAGQMPLDPTILLMSPRFAHLLESLKQHADLVILDGPPVLVMPDVDILASQVESMVIVVTDGMTTRSQFRKAIRRIQEYDGVSLLGAVFNQVRLRERAYAYYYYRHKSSYPAWLSKIWRRFVSKEDEAARLAAQDAPSSERLFSLAEAAQRLGVNRATVRRWGRSGRLPIVQEGRRWKVRQDDLETLIAQQTIGQTELQPLSKADPDLPSGNGHGSNIDISSQEGAQAR
jgi:succinoglycan biosynthesis transport protein ExoP